MDIVRRLVWFGVVCAFASFAVFFVLGNYFLANAADQGPLVVRDVLGPGVHHLTGILLLSNTCDELTVETQQVGTTTYLIDFHTWQDPSVPCPAAPTPRAFNTVVFAPSTGVSFTAQLDGTAFPIVVLPSIITLTSP